jgi:hypothetical protein
MKVCNDQNHVWDEFDGNCLTCAAQDSYELQQVAIICQHGKFRTDCVICR